MNILVNIHSLTPPLTGIGRYTFNLLSHLQDHPRVDKLWGVGASGLLDAQALAATLSEIDNASCQKSSVINPGLFRKIAAGLPGTRRVYRRIHQWQVSRQQSRLGQFVYWEPNYVMLPFDGPAVATIHDLSHLRLPEFHPKSRVEEMNRGLPHTLQNAQRLISVSDFTRQEMQKYLSPSQPIDIVSPGVGNDFFNINNVQRQACRDAYQLPEKYILSVATLEPRKNLHNLVKAYLQLPDSLRREFPLVLAGVRGWLTQQLDELLKPLQSTGQAHVIGYVEQQHIPALYANATLTAYVSFYEGFGMPVAESMAAGTPVLTSAISSMPEVAAGNAVLADPHDIDDIQKKLAHLLENKTLRHTLGTKGKAHARHMTWDRSAQALFDSLLLAQEHYTP